MKKVILVLLVAVIVSSCGVMKIADVQKLRVGMNRQEVEEYMGRPNRILSTDYTSNGLSEVYEYNNYNRDVYAIEYLDGYLVGYSFLYQADDVLNPPGRPVPPNRPSQPARPGQSARPNENNNSQRPSQSNRPGEGSQSERPKYPASKDSKSTDNNSRPSSTKEIQNAE